LAERNAFVEGGAAAKLNTKINGASLLQKKL